MRILFLDDDVTRVDEFEKNVGFKVCHVYTYPDFVTALARSTFDLIMLDHDLGPDDAGTGAMAAKYIAENRLEVGETTVIIHSANPIGVANMMSHLKYADHLQVNVIHFAWNKARYNPTTGLTFTI